jgi:kynureninase
LPALSDSGLLARPPRYTDAVTRIEPALLEARQRDTEDPLREYRNEFCCGPTDDIYMLGNSLGRTPRRARELVMRELSRWEENRIDGWSQGWWTLSQRVGGKIARIVGAGEDEVLCCDSTSANIFKLAGAALNARKSRKNIITESGNFPSDLYALQSCARTFDRQFCAVRLSNLAEPDFSEIEDLVDEDTALLSLSHVSYRSAAIFDMRRLTSAAHDAGAMVLWDLCHSVGAIPIELKASGADLAVGCTYKYLNGGPGSPAFLYVRKDLQDELVSPMWGWFGQKDAFDFGAEYAPREGVMRFLVGSTPILSMIAIEAGADLLSEAGMEAVRKKSILQTEMMAGLWREHLSPLGVTFESPLDATRRGSHVALGHEDAWRIVRALKEDRRIIADFRAPNVIRMSVAPLYTTFEEAAKAMLAVRDVIESGSYERFSQDRAAIT